MGDYFSISRWLGIVGKEFIQLKRDRLTFGMIVGIPIIQLTLFGFAINSDPKHLPTAALIADRSEFSRDILAALRNTEYFAFIGEARDEADAERMLATGEAQFVVTIPADFSKRLVRGERPALLVEADATDPVATGNAIAAVNQLAQPALTRARNGPLGSLAQWLFKVPMLGSYSVLYLSVLLFIAANLMLGLTISSIAQNQLQAMQMTFFFFLPSILLSGFMFPFRGMPDWAQYIGQALPLTHFLRIVRGVLLKGNGWSEIVPEARPIALFMLAVIAIGLRFFRSTLD